MEQHTFTLGQASSKENALHKIHAWRCLNSKSYTIKKITRYKSSKQARRKDYFDMTVSYFTTKSEGKHLIQSRF